jgi:hypothetical protein
MVSNLFGVLRSLHCPRQTRNLESETRMAVMYNLCKSSSWSSISASHRGVLLTKISRCPKTESGYYFVYVSYGSQRLLYTSLLLFTEAHSVLNIRALQPHSIASQRMESVVGYSPCSVYRNSPAERRRNRHIFNFFFACLPSLLDSPIPQHNAAHPEK